MAKSSKAGCSNCSADKSRSSTLSDFSVEICPSSPSKKNKDKSK